MIPPLYDRIKWTVLNKVIWSSALKIFLLVSIETYCKFVQYIETKTVIATNVSSLGIQESVRMTWGHFRFRWLIFKSDPHNEIIGEVMILVMPFSCAFAIRFVLKT